MQLKVTALALASGIVCGVVFFLATLIATAQHGGGHLYLMHNICPAYVPTIGGAFLGLIYGFVYGFIFAAVVARLYNLFARTK